MPACINEIWQIRDSLVSKFMTNHKHLLCCSVILYKYFSQNVENVGSQIALEVETDDVVQ